MSNFIIRASQIFRVYVDCFFIVEMNSANQIICVPGPEISGWNLNGESRRSQVERIIKKAISKNLSKKGKIPNIFFFFFEFPKISCNFNKHPEQNFNRIRARQLKLQPRALQFLKIKVFQLKIGLLNCRFFPVMTLVFSNFRDTIIFGIMFC